MIVTKMNATSMRISILGVLIATPFLLSCKPLEQLTSQVISANRMMKITFELSTISADGLVGSADSLRSLSYEFCIPANPEHLAEVRALDPSVQISRSPGRIGCTKDQYLAIGDTHQARWHEVLMAIARLNYVQRIDEFIGE